MQFGRNSVGKKTFMSVPAAAVGRLSHAANKAKSNTRRRSRRKSLRKEFSSKEKQPVTEEIKREEEDSSEKTTNVEESKHSPVQDMPRKVSGAVINELSKKLKQRSEEMSPETVVTPTESAKKASGNRRETGSSPRESVASKRHAPRPQRGSRKGVPKARPSSSSTRKGQNPDARSSKLNYRPWVARSKGSSGTKSRMSLPEKPVAGRKSRAQKPVAEPDPFDDNALFRAIHDKDENECFKLLASRKINVNLKDSNGFSALHRIAFAMNNADIVSALLNYPNGRKLINEKNAGYDGVTPAMCACLANNPETLECLLANGANVAILDDNGDDVFSYAKTPDHNHEECLQSLRATGFSP